MPDYLGKACSESLSEQRKLTPRLKLQCYNQTNEIQPFQDTVHRTVRNLRGKTGRQAVRHHIRGQFLTLCAL